MAQATGSTKQIIGILQTFGGLYWNPLDYTGPLSYVQGGDSIGATSFGFNNTIWALQGSVDQSNAYRVEPRPLNNGVTKWQLVWISMATGLEAAAGANLSAYTVRLSAIGQ
jgi:hypothetical protein